jgi:hypothetical protein
MRVAKGTRLVELTKLDSLFRVCSFSLQTGCSSRRVAETGLGSLQISPNLASGTHSRPSEHVLSCLPLRVRA